MVFSIFKKQPEKMPERPAAKPKPPATPAEGAQVAAPPPEEKKPLSSPSGFGDSGFGDDFTASSMLAIHVEHDVDPVQVDIEQAAVLFANSQDSAARSVLETAARAHTGAAAERLWRMLLDLLQVLGDRPAFEKLGMEFAQVCETSPPTWREETMAPKPAAGSGQATVMLQGVLAGSDSPGFAKLREALDKKQPIQVNLSKLASLDDFAAGVLCEMFRKARKQNLAITLEGADGCIERLEGRLVAGQKDYEKGWLLLLELYQLLGEQERFDEKAVDYAVTFEVSPPSWETLKAGAVKAVQVALEPVEEVYPLAGECKNQRFDDLQGFLELHEHPVIDCARLKRIDFASAGMMQNILRPFHQQGKEIVIRHPHHLVAELFNIVGVSAFARIVVTKF